MTNKIEKTCQDILIELTKDGWRHQVTRKDLEKAIMMIRGFDDRTIKKWIKILEMFGYIIPHAPNVCSINPYSHPDLFNLVKNHPQSKIQ